MTEMVPQPPALANRLPAERPREPPAFGPPAFGPTAYGAPAPPLTLAFVVTTAFLRWRPLLLALLLPPLLALAAALLSTPRWTAQSALVVLATRESTGSTDISGFGPNIQSVELLKVVRTEIELMESDDTAQLALRSLGPTTVYPELGQRGLFGFLPPPPEAEQLARASEALRRSLRASTDANSNLMRVSFAHADRAMALRTLGAVLEAYYEQRARLFQGGNARLLTTEMQRFGGELRDLEAQIEATKRSRGILEVGQDIRAAGTRLDAILAAEDQLRLQVAAARAQLASAQALLARTPERVFASEDSSNLSPNDESRNVLTRLNGERTRMAANYAPDYPGLAELDRRIEGARTAVRENAQARFGTTRQVRNPSVELLSGRVVSLQLEADALTRQLTELGQQKAQAQARSAAVLEGERVLADMQRRRDGLAAIYQQFTARQAGTQVDEDARRTGSANVQVLQPPTAPLAGTSFRRLLVSGGVLAGVMAAAGLALLLAFLRRTFATVEEAERGLTLPSLGAFASVERAAVQLREQPEVAELASLLLDVRLDDRVSGRPRRPQVIQFVSATDDDDGRGVLARAVAIELAERRQQSTLLVDLQGDGRTHLASLGSQVLPVERTPGHVLAFSTVLPKLWIAFDARTSHLADPRVAQLETETLLAMLRREFDCIVVIGPEWGPERSESYAMRRLTALVDANIMVVRAERTRGAVAREFRDWVLSSGSVLLGLCFTGRRSVLPARVARLL